MMYSRFFFAALTLITFFAACKDDSDQATVHIRLTDGPGDYQQVNVDILQVRVKTAEDTAQWLDLQTNAGVYNLLDFQNGLDTLIATGNVPAAILKEVRFILGPDNTIMVDSVLHELVTPSAEESGLKVKIDKNLGLDVNTFVLDFDAQASVLQQGNGVYRLKPVIKLK